MKKASKKEIEEIEREMQERVEFFRSQNKLLEAQRIEERVKYDLEMLRAADVAVCPENAIDSVKEICDLCLCDHKQGVIADLIEHIEREIRKGKS